jgi:type IV fimbrial biogenesis protein FimT
MIDLVRDYRATAALNGIIGQVQYTRSTAITARRTVTLCPGRPPQCGKRDSWHLGSFVFIDRNKNGRKDSGDQILKAFGPVVEKDHGRFTWRSFRNRKSLSINGTGLTNWQNGSFRYCPANGDPRFARQAILNAQARVRHARDRDGDGIREDAQGRPIKC